MSEYIEYVRICEIEKNIPKNISEYQKISYYIRICQKILEYRNTSEYINIYQSLSECIRIYQNIQKISE